MLLSVASFLIRSNRSLFGAFGQNLTKFSVSSLNKIIRLEGSICLGE
jgi:hypothetical protein